MIGQPAPVMIPHGGLGRLLPGRMGFGMQNQGLANLAYGPQALPFTSQFQPPQNAGSGGYGGNGYAIQNMAEARGLPRSY